MDELSDASFIAQSVSFLEALAYLMEHFGEVAERAQSGGGEVSDFDILAMQNMIRI